MRITVLGESGSDYGIEVSSNLVNWTFWTSRVVTNGMMSVIDGDTLNFVPKFYRVVLLP